MRLNAINEKDIPILRDTLIYDHESGLFIRKELDIPYFLNHYLGTEIPSINDKGRRMTRLIQNVNDAKRARDAYNKVYAGKATGLCQSSRQLDRAFVGFMNHQGKLVSAYAPDVAFAIFHGETPERIAHVNLDRRDIRIKNLRGASGPFKGYKDVFIKEKRATLRVGVFQRRGFWYAKTIVGGRLEEVYKSINKDDVLAAYTKRINQLLGLPPLCLTYSPSTISDSDEFAHGRVLLH